MKKKAKSNERKSLQELTIKDDFMFGAVMLNPEIYRQGSQGKPQNGLR